MIRCGFFDGVMSTVFIRCYMFGGVIRKVCYLCIYIYFRNNFKDSLFILDMDI